MKLLHLRKYFYLSSLLAISIIGIILFFTYLSQINILGDFFVESNQNIISIKTISPLNKIRSVELVDGKFDGYYKSITIESSTPQINITNKYLGKNSKIKINQVAFNNYKIENQDISTFDKIIIVLIYNKLILLEFLLLTISLLWIFRNRLKLLSFFINEVKSINKNLNRYFLYVKNNKIKMLLAIIIDLIICLILRYALSIDFAILYGCSSWLIYPIVYCVFLIPIIGLLLERQVKAKLSSFFAFWIIFFLQYFIISPNNFAGNFGFHGAFQDFIQVASNSNFNINIFTSDTGYLAILPRTIYWLTIVLNPSLSQVLAVTSMLTIVVYSYIMASLLKNNFSFLWVNRNLAFVFVIMISIFPIFSLVPCIFFSLSITDISYYGILFALISLMSIKNISSFKLILLCLFNCLLILSKAHFIVLFPVFVFSIFLWLKKKNKKAFWFSIACTCAIIIQAIFCYSNLNSIANASKVLLSSVSVNTMSFSEQLLFTIIYFIKSYISILIPFENSSIILYIIVMGFIGFLILYLTYKSFRIILFEEKKTIAYWFIACNITALSSSFFYAYTLSSEDIIMYHNLIQFVEIVKLKTITYTIGVHTLLAVSVIPYLAILSQRYFQKINFKFKKDASNLLFSLLFINGMMFNNVSLMFPEFWKMTQNDKWSNEWRKLAPLLKQKEYYVPIIFYPEYKQNICTDGLEVAYDILPINESSFKMPTSLNLNSLIVLNKFELSNDNFPFYVELYHNHIKKNVWKPFYQPNNDCRFIVFTNNTACESDSIVFKNRKFKNIKLNTHIRVISEK